MKKFVIGLVIGIIMATATTAIASQGISIYVNGNLIQSDVPAFVQNGRTMVPLRFIAEALGAQVKWDDATQSVYITTQQAQESEIKPEIIAEKVLKLSSYRQWSLLYEYLHPDIQALFKKDQFIAEREKNGAIFAFVKDFQVDDATILDQWKDKEGTGQN